MKFNLKRKGRNGLSVEKLAKRGKRARIRVGVLSDTMPHPKGTSGQTIAEVAFWNEMGTDKIPPRPFLSTTLRDNDYYKPTVLQGLKEYLLKGDAVLVLLNAIGLRAAADVKNKITSIMTPPNALSTQRQKANKSHVKASLVNNPLIDSGTMRASIAHEVIK